MEDIPFSISDDAAACLRRILPSRQASPETAAALGCSYSYQCRDANGRIFERYPSEQFVVGYDSREAFLSQGYQEFLVLGFNVFVHPTTLEILRGKELVLELVAVGFPNPADRIKPLLLCK